MSPTNACPVVGYSDSCFVHTGYTGQGVMTGGYWCLRNSHEETRGSSRLLRGSSNTEIHACYANAALCMTKNTAFHLEIQQIREKEGQHASHIYLCRDDVDGQETRWSGMGGYRAACCTYVQGATYIWTHEQRFVAQNLTFTRLASPAMTPKRLRLGAIVFQRSRFPGYPRSHPSLLMMGVER